VAVIITNTTICSTELQKQQHKWYKGCSNIKCILPLSSRRTDTVGSPSSH